MTAISASLSSRLWTYQSERFPFAKTIPLLAVFSAASITVSATLAGRALPDLQAYLVGFGLVFILFFQMRVCDEVKDIEDDRAYRPDRPIPRGLVSLRLIVALGLLTIPIALWLAMLHGHNIVWLLVLVWIWLAAMTFEFGATQWLKSRPVVYLLSHMAIMPIIDLLLTAIEWKQFGTPNPALWLFLALSFTNGCVLEIGRKLWAPENELQGVDSYSSLWGAKPAAKIWLAFVVASLVLLSGVGFATNAIVLIAPVGITGTAMCVWAAITYSKNPTVQTEKRVDGIAGLWVFICYTSAGFAPLLV